MSNNSKVVLDKNFVQGAKQEQIRSLCLAGQAIMPDVLFYEMLTTSEPGRSRCFSKFPGENPVIIGPNVGQLLSVETETHEPCGKPSMHAPKGRYQFNSKLLEGTYVLPVEAQAILDAERSRVDSEVDTLITMVRTAPLVFPGTFEGSDESRSESIERHRETLARDPEPIVRFYASLDRPGAKIQPPPAERLTPDWMFFRWLQVKLLCSLDLASKYGSLEMEITPNLRHRLENFVWDTHYLMLGALEGGLATNDRWVRDAFLRICPKGRLLPTE